MNRNGFLDGRPFFFSDLVITDLFQILKLKARRFKMRESYITKILREYQMFGYFVNLTKLRMF